jgi:hypothetical protein
MHVDLRLLTIIIAAQSFLMGALLLAVASPRSGKPSTGLALRGAAMLCQGVGYVLISLRGDISDLWGVVAAFGLVVFGHALTLVGLRMLLGLNEYRWQIGVTLAAAWFAMLLPGWFYPDRRAVAALSELYSIVYAIAVSWPLAVRLRRVSSIGERVLLGTALFMLATQAWLLVSTGAPIAPGTSTSIVRLLTALMPTLTGVAFLLMYYEAMQTDVKKGLVS